MAHATRRLANRAATRGSPDNYERLTISVFGSVNMSDQFTLANVYELVAEVGF